MSYGDYLHLDALLSAQHPISDAHDEMLFVVQHQVSELWMRLALHELGAARCLIAAGDLRPAFKMLARVSRIFEQLEQCMGRAAHNDPQATTRGFAKRSVRPAGFSRCSTG